MKQVQISVTKDPAKLTGLGTVGLVLAYILASRAIDTGSLWQYIGVLILVIYSIRFLAKAISISIHERKK